MPYFIALSLIPVFIEGIWLKDWADTIFAERVSLVPIFLVINGLIILAIAWFTQGEKRLDELTWANYLLIGVIQGFAVLPGISRLGLTLCAGLWLRLNWYEAVRLTFILALPAILGGITWQAPDLISSLASDMPEILGLDILRLAISILTVFVMSLIGLRTLTASMLERRTLDFFGYYCCLLGAFTFTYLAVSF